MSGQVSRGSAREYQADVPRCDRKVGNPFQTKQGSRPSCPDQEGRKGSEEGVPENRSVPLEGDRGFGELCGSHQGCQVARDTCPLICLILAS